MVLKTFVSGEVLTASDTNLYLVNTIFARKTADESVTSSTTLQDDNHLTATVAANSTYELSAGFFHDGATGGDFKFQFSTPASTVGNIVVHRILNTGTVFLDVQLFGGSINGTYGCGTLGVGTLNMTHVHGLVVVASTSGTFKLTWAQETSSGTATTLFEHSYFCLRRVD